MVITGSIIRRAIITIGLLGTFVLTASVFAPDKSQAREFGLIRDPIDDEDSYAESSTNPHEGLRSLGSFEGTQYIIKAFCTENGPRFSIYQASNHRELGVLMTPEQISRMFPEIQLRGVWFEVPTDGDEAQTTQLMMAEPLDRVDQP